MIQHHAFFETLGELDESSAEWRTIFAGLSVLRLVDRFVINEERPIPASAELDTSRTSVEAVAEGNPARAILFNVIDSISSDTEVTERLGRHLISYGRALDLEARWPLAVDVLRSVADSFRERDHPRIVAEAATLLGAAARSTGDWVTSDRAYARAEHLAERMGERALKLSAQLGMANSYMIRGNLPAAEQELSLIVAEAHRARLEEIEARALHVSASVAHSKGEYERAIHLAYRSLELTARGSARDRLIADIGAAYGALGLSNVARDAYTIVLLTSPHQWVRWQASLNLMELAVMQGDEAAFDQLVKELESAQFDPKLRAYFLYFKALGNRRFKETDAADQFDDAIRFADSNRLYQLAFEIEAASSRPLPSIKEQSAAGEETLRIAEVLEHLRHEATA